MILIIDNYDSFVHNLARYVRELGWETLVLRNDEVSVEEARSLGPSHVIVSPGPCTPAEGGVSNGIIAALGPHTATLGVCLGHQCVAAVYGARVVRSPRPMHGKTSRIHHGGAGLFTGIASPFTATRYHSLIVEPSSVPPELEVTAWTEAGEVMALRHREHRVVGVQFHPESVLTEHGHQLLRNFLEAPGP